ncbi:MAG: nucleotide sugar dehydrogenase [Deltaproteobacteria bacterium]|nr:nucleotide sugar dehydrogenase [Deltaproteobacteria bacterium]
MGDPQRDLQVKISTGTALIGVIGLGYVGLPLVLHFAGKGFRVLGFDADKQKVEALNEGRSYIMHIPGEQIAGIRFKESGSLFEATHDFKRLGEPDALLICVPTPLNRFREPNLEYVERSAKDIAATLRRGQLIALESTTYPGTTDEIILPILAESNLRVGEDFFLAYSPEREDPGNAAHELSNTPKVVGGYTPACLELGAALYGQVVEQVVPVSSTRVAEMTKLLENIYRAVNIALVNELKVLCHRMGLDVYEVINAAKTKPFGFQAFYPGPGLGGHCIPIDPFYLTYKAREYDFSTRFIELAGDINTSMPYYVIERLVQGLNNQGRSINGARVLVVGIAYKKDVDDLRESPSLKLIDLLLKRGAQVDYHDPHIPVMPRTRRHDFNLRSVPLTPDNLASYDAVLIATDHSSLDYDKIAAHAALVVDTRNVFPGAKMAKIIKA